MPRPSAPSSDPMGRVLPGALPPGTAWAVAAGFVLVLAGTGAVDLLAPVERARAVGLEADEDEALAAAARFADGSWARWVERELRLRSRVRATVGPRYALALYRWLRETDARVLAGPGGWLFLRGRALGAEGPEDELAGVAAGLLASLERRLQGLGVELVVLPVPRKAVVCADRLPRGVDPRPGLEPALLDACARHGVRAVDLLAAFAGHSSDELFLPRDTHWTDGAVALAAEALARATRRWIPPERRATPLRATPPRPRPADLVRYLGFDELAPDLADERVPGLEVVDAQGRPVVYRLPDAMPSTALVGTSYSVMSDLPGFFEHATGTRLWSGARVAATPMVPLARLLEAPPASGLPELLVLEVPCHQLFRRPALARVGEVFAAAPPAAAPRSLRALAEPRARAELAERTRLVRRAELPELHSGDGVLGVRARGRVEGAPVRLEVATPSCRISTPWPADVPELVLPIVDPSGSARVDVLVEPSPGAAPPSFELLGLELVVESDDARATALALDTPRADGTGWLQTAAFPGTEQLGPHAVLELECEPALTARELSLALRCDDGSALAWTFAPRSPTRALFVDLDAAAGRRPVALELRGPGPPPGGASRARLAPALRPH